MKQTIRTLLAKHGNLPVSIDDVADGADLYDAGLSSFASVQVMLALEEEFDIEFPEHLLTFIRDFLKFHLFPYAKHKEPCPLKILATMKGVGIIVSGS